MANIVGQGNPLHEQDKLDIAACRVVGYYNWRQTIAKRTPTHAVTARNSEIFLLNGPDNGALSNIYFNRIRVRFAIRDFIPAEVISQTSVSFKRIAVIFFGFWYIVHHTFGRLLSALPNHFPTQIIASLPIYDGQDVNPVFLLPIKVNNSSIRRF